MSQEKRQGQTGEYPLNDEPQTVEDAQQLIAQALADIHANRRVDDGEERMLPAHHDAIRRLKDGLQNLPADVSTVVIGIAFDTVTIQTRKDLPGWMGSTLYTLQHLLKAIGADIQEGERVEFEFAVLPNSYPDELKRLTHGSRSRELTGDIRETVHVGYDYGLHIMEIKPYGAPMGMAGVWAINAKPFRVPLQIVERIQLLREERPFTPYVEGEGWENIRVVPVQRA